jgi:hypothetical protein
LKYVPSNKKKLESGKNNKRNKSPNKNESPNKKINSNGTYGSLKKLNDCFKKMHMKQNISNGGSYTNKSNYFPSHNLLISQENSTMNWNSNVESCKRIDISPNRNESPKKINSNSTYGSLKPNEKIEIPVNKGKEMIEISGAIILHLFFFYKSFVFV